GDCFSKPR
nr:Chain C, Apoptosis-inducing factor 3 [Homo sapiens]6SK8_D Chain D, Apoptosis-inducing factor 3 [Homo sapiens]